MVQGTHTSFQHKSKTHGIVDTKALLNSIFLQKLNNNITIYPQVPMPMQHGSSMPSFPLDSTSTGYDVLSVCLIDIFNNYCVSAYLHSGLQ